MGSHRKSMLALVSGIAMSLCFPAVAAEIAPEATDLATCVRFLPRQKLLLR